jgi:hypothetical protein
VSFAAITLCVASQRVFVVVYFGMTQFGNFWLHPGKLNLGVTLTDQNHILHEVMKKCNSEKLFLLFTLRAMIAQSV